MNVLVDGRVALRPVRCGRRGARSPRHPLEPSSKTAPLFSDQG